MPCGRSQGEKYLAHTMRSIYKQGLLSLYSTFCIQYTWSKIVRWYMTTHDITWHDTTNMEFLIIWQCQAFVATMVLDVLLKMIFLPPPHDLGMKNLQWSQVLNNGCKLMSLKFLLINQLVSLAARESLSILPSFLSFYIIPSWHDRELVPKIHSWQDNINKKIP